MVGKLAAGDTRLSSTVTAADYMAMEAANDRAGIGRFIVQRFGERYFEPTLTAPRRQGFTLLAIGCLVIESLECFYQGLGDSTGKSHQCFRQFFARRTGLEVFGGGLKDWFFEQIRCGIPHQAEVTGGWRILRSGPLLDEQQKAISARKFMELLQQAVGDYATQLETNDELWANCRRKMAVICANCH